MKETLFEDCWVLSMVATVIMLVADKLGAELETWVVFAPVGLMLAITILSCIYWVVSFTIFTQRRSERE